MMDEQQLQKIWVLLNNISFGVKHEKELMSMLTKYFSEEDIIKKKVLLQKIDSFIVQIKDELDVLHLIDDLGLEKDLDKAHSA